MSRCTGRKETYWSNAVCLIRNVAFLTTTLRWRSSERPEIRISCKGGPPWPPIGGSRWSRKTRRGPQGAPNRCLNENLDETLDESLVADGALTVSARIRARTIEHSEDYLRNICDKLRGHSRLRGFESRCGRRSLAQDRYSNDGVATERLKRFKRSRRHRLLSRQVFQTMEGHRLC